MSAAAPERSHRYMIGSDYYIDLTGRLLQRQKSALLTPVALRTLSMAAILEATGIVYHSPAPVEIYTASKARELLWREALSMLAPHATESHYHFFSYRSMTVRNHQRRFYPAAPVVIDTVKLTRDQDTALWKALSPAIRSHAGTVTMLIEEADWPRHLCHVELLGHMDRHLVQASELDYRRSLRG